MPDNQNESKLMAMLERRGIVRKADSGDENTEPDPGAARSRPEADLRSLFGSSATETPNVKPAARQPVPGMTSTVSPAERPQNIERELPKTAGRVEVLQMKSEQSDPLRPVTPSDSIITPEPVTPPKQATPPAQETTPPVQVAASTRFQPPVQVTPPVQVASPVQKEPLEPPRPLPVTTPLQSAVIGAVNPFREDDAWDEEQESISAASEEAPPQPPPIESYTDRFLDVEQLYDALALRSKRTDTIYLVEEYLKTLPDSLPDESRREIVRRIVAASGFDFDILLGDGVLRVKMLKDYAERFARHTDDYVMARQYELDDLEQQILRIRRLIENRRELHKRQFFAIEAEAQRLKEILTFISG